MLHRILGKKAFSEKRKEFKDFYDFVMNSRPNYYREEPKSSTSKSKSERVEYKKERSYFKLKSSLKSPQIMQDIKFFRLEEDFSLNDLKSRYLNFAKLYHPDQNKNDKSVYLYSYKGDFNFSED